MLQSLCRHGSAVLIDEIPNAGAMLKQLCDCDRGFVSRYVAEKLTERVVELRATILNELEDRPYCEDLRQRTTVEQDVVSYAGGPFVCIGLQ